MKYYIQTVVWDNGHLLQDTISSGEVYGPFKSKPTLKTLQKISELMRRFATKEGTERNNEFIVSFQNEVMTYSFMDKSWIPMPNYDSIMNYSYWVTRTRAIRLLRATHLIVCKYN